MQKHHLSGLVAVAASVVMAGSASAAIDIVFNYDYDDANFFSNQAARDRLEQAASFYEAAFGDTLDAITPGGGNTWTPSFFDPATGSWVNGQTDLSIAADTIVVYAGARNISSLGIGGPGGYAATTSTFVDEVVGRGQSGALGSAETQTDFSPWGGSIAFDTNISINSTSYNWYFGETTVGLDSSEFDFLSVAVHELGHLLGFGIANSWENLVNSTGSGDDQQNNFTGSASMAVYGGVVPLEGGENPGHWQNGLLGNTLAMDPFLTNGQRVLLAPLDYAGFADMGWEVVPEPATVTLLALGMLAVVTRRRAA